jgi:hypothetical protein
VGKSTKVGDITKGCPPVNDINKVERPPLLPLRHAQGDFFVCDIFDAAPKGDMAAMQHPIFTLATKPDIRIKEYESPNGKAFVRVTPSVAGHATMHDRDILIYCISQVIAAVNAGTPVTTKTLRFKAYDLLVATNRTTAGTGYMGLRAALERLRGTTIQTNITTNDVEQIDGFGLIDSYKVVRETRDGRMQDIEVTLSDWVFNAIAGHEVLTLNRQYFQLRKPLERRLYELARKHCGKQDEWRIGLDKLQKKAGSTSSAKEFKRLVRLICKADEEHGHMPDYEFRLVHDILEIKPRVEFLETLLEHTDNTLANTVRLSVETHEKARKIAPSWDVHYLEQEWRMWMSEPPRNADAAFLGFCKKWFERKGRAA